MCRSFFVANTKTILSCKRLEFLSRGRLSFVVFKLVRILFYKLLTISIEFYRTKQSCPSLRKNCRMLENLLFYYYRCQKLERNQKSYVFTKSVPDGAYKPHPDHFRDFFDRHRRISKVSWLGLVI